jgi:hypothetical protein
MKTFSEVKSLWENSQKETPNLEFKADVSPNSDEIAKDISSFANGEGGVIIYGLAEDSTKGIATKSFGIDLKKKDERIQQIVSSSIAPELQIRIDTIQSVDEAIQQPLVDKGFIAVKIPKSEMYIHQVTTTGKYYIRNNTQATPYKYDPQELKESDIEYRYRKRFENRTRLESSLDRKMSELVNEYKWPCYLFLGALPSAIASPSRTIDKILFREMLFTKANLEDDSTVNDTEFRYQTISDFDLYRLNKPTLNGRVGTRRNRTLTIEMNNDGSVYILQHLPEQGDIQSWRELIYMAAEFMHMIKRFYFELNLYGGVTIRFLLKANFDTDRDGNITAAGLHEFGSVERIVHPPTGKYVLKPIPIDKHFQFADYDLAKATTELMEKLFASIGIEGIEKKCPSFVKDVTAYVNNLKKS